MCDDMIRQRPDKIAWPFVGGNTMSANIKMSRRGALKLGAGAFIGAATLPMMTGYVNAQGAAVLKVAHPSFNQDWSPMRGGGSSWSRWPAASR